MKTQILLVDDEEHMLRLLQFCLKPIPASIHCVKRGNAAVEFLKANHPNLVLLDYAMPGMDGVETLRQIRAQECGGAVPVIMLTARDQTVIRKEAAGLHVHAFLTKPFSPSDLVRRAREFQGAKGARCREMRHDARAAVRALSGIFQAKPSEASLENPLCEIVVTKVGPAAVFPSKTHRNS